MTEDEKRINKVENRVDNLETKFEMYMKLQDERFNSFMQQRTELRQDMKDMQNRFYTKMDNLDAKIDGIAKHVQTLSIAAIAGIGGMFVAIVVMVGTVVYSVLTR